MTQKKILFIIIAFCLSLISVVFIIQYLVSTNSESGLFLGLACITIGLSVNFAYLGNAQNSSDANKIIQYKAVCSGMFAFSIAIGLLTIVDAIISRNFSLLSAFLLLLSLSLGSFSIYTFLKLK